MHFDATFFATVGLFLFFALLLIAVGIAALVIGGVFGLLFAVVGSGEVRIRIDHRYPLAEVAQAHRDLEARKTTGSSVLIPD